MMGVDDMAAKEESIIICFDCGKEIITKYTQTVRCKECMKKHKREYNKEWKRQNPYKKNSKSKERLEREELHTLDTKENIQKCLSCTRPKCNNCLSMLVSSKGEKE